MRILFLAPQPFYELRGTPIAEKALLESLSRLGHRVTVVTYHLGEDVEIEGCTIHRIPEIPGIRDISPGFSLKKVICDAFLFREATRLAGKEDFHLVHAVEEAAFIAMWIQRRHGIPYVYDMDSSLVEQLLDQRAWLGPAGGAMAALERLAVRESTGVLAVCRYLEERARECSPRTVIGRVEDFSMLEGTRDGEERLEETIGGAGPIVLYVGNLAPYQGIDLLLESWPRVVESVPDARLVLIGGSEKRIRRYEDEVARRGLSRSVHFLGPRPLGRLGHYLGQAEVLVSPRTQGTNTPMKIYSYLDSGTPVVATRRLTHTQVLDDKISLLLEPRPEEFGDGIARLLGDRRHREALAAAAKSRVREEYSPAAFHRKVRNFYRRLPVQGGGSET